IRLRRLPLMIAALGAMLVTTAILYWSSVPIWALYILCFFFGFFQSAHVLNFAIAHEINRPAANGAAIGFTNMLTVVGGALFLPVVGIFLQYGWTGQKLNGVAEYSVADYHWSLVLLPTVQLLAFIIATVLLKETRCKPQYEQRAKRGRA
ncbi:MAG TPA: MFS transporter, partial [Gammaproteobacteria bacterium]|nr:MFS transporter [Gammaproteobacteria bacterium]